MAVSRAAWSRATASRRAGSVRGLGPRRASVRAVLERYSRWKPRFWATPFRVWAARNAASQSWLLMALSRLPQLVSAGYFPMNFRTIASLGRRRKTSALLPPIFA